MCDKEIFAGVNTSGIVELGEWLVVFGVGTGWPAGGGLLFLESIRASLGSQCREQSSIFTTQNAEVYYGLKFIMSTIYE